MSELNKRHYLQSIESLLLVGRDMWLLEQSDVRDLSEEIKRRVIDNSIDN